jgi:hypothetical protein
MSLIVAGPFLLSFFFLEAPVMTQADLNRAVAAATGESVETIARQGFCFIEVPQMERDPLVYDWDDEAARLLGDAID